jgi:hypothetical protein
MIQQAPRADPFKEQLRGSLQHETLKSRVVKIARHLPARRAIIIFEIVQYWTAIPPESAYRQSCLRRGVSLHGVT